MSGLDTRELIYMAPIGPPRRIRTCNLRIRSPMLYPVELGADCRHGAGLINLKNRCMSIFASASASGHHRDCGAVRFMPPAAVEMNGNPLYSGQRRGGRVVEGAPLLREYTGDRIEGSNPFLSATLEHKCERGLPQIVRRFPTLAR